MDPQPRSTVFPPDASTPGWEPNADPSTRIPEPGVEFGNGHAPTGEFKAALSQFGELKAYVGYLLAAKLDSLKLTLRNVGIYAALGVVALMAGGAIIVTAAVLVVLGLAHALGGLLWDKWWLGDLIVGLLLLGAVAGGIVYGLKALTGTSRKKTVSKYENRQRDQRINFGHDVRERAGKPAAEHAAGGLNSTEAGVH